MSTATKSRQPKQRFFSILFDIEGTTYKVFPLPCDPAVGSKAFRFAKQGGDGEVYDVHADSFGLQCQCLGFLRHGRCKHVQTIQAAGKLFNVFAPTASQHRGLGDLARNAPEQYAQLAGESQAWDGYPESAPWTDADLDGFAAQAGQ